MLDWGFRSFQQVTAFEAGEMVAEASVYGGVEVACRSWLMGQSGSSCHAPAGLSFAPASSMRARSWHRSRRGRRVGAFRVWDGDRLIQETPLYTAEAVGRGPIHARALDALGELLFGWL